MYISKKYSQQYITESVITLKCNPNIKLMKKILVSLFVCISINAFSQDGVTFKVEELSKPSKLLYKQAVHEIYEGLIVSDFGMESYELKKNRTALPINIIAKSNAPDSLVSYRYHSFFNGMYQAYADHRPFVLSPDMMWLLISQGFARHVNANAEVLRDKFVHFDGKLSLIVVSKSIDLENPNSPWESIFPQFTKQIAEHTGNELIGILSADFTTTTPVEKMASEITLMEAMEPYFEFIVFRVVCGIPEITLKGTPEDWQKVLAKTKKLGQYDLTWWTKELEPILEEFVKTSKGEIDKLFWQNMFKYHSQNKYGAPNIIDGWIVKFFPYDKDGKRNNLKELAGDKNLPEEIVKVDLKHIKIVGGSTITTPLELWAGFIGLKQNRENFTLTPQIGWMIRKKDVNKTGLIRKLKTDNDLGGIAIRVQEIPKEIYDLGEIEKLDISFVDSIIVPDKLKAIEIKQLTLTGKIDKTEIERISKMFPNSKLIINREIIRLE